MPNIPSYHLMIWVSVDLCAHGALCLAPERAPLLGPLCNLVILNALASNHMFSRMHMAVLHLWLVFVCIRSYRLALAGCGGSLSLHYTIDTHVLVRL